MKEDHVDRIRRESNLPLTGEASLEVVGRIFRYSAYLEARVGSAFAPFGLNRSDADLLAILLRSAEPHIAPSRLASQLICSTGTMTNRLDRLEKAGLIRRLDDPNDRRGVLVQLTTKGRKTIVAARAARKKVELDLVPGLTLAERRELSSLLRKVLVVAEDADARGAKK